MAKVLVLQLLHQSFQKILRLISFRINWFDLLAVQGTLKHHSSKASILWQSLFFMVQLSHPYMTTSETIALTICHFVIKVISLLFNLLARFVIAFLPRSKHLLISWMQSPSAVMWSPRKLNLLVFILFPHLFVWEGKKRKSDICTSQTFSVCNLFQVWDCYTLHMNEF